MGVMASLLSVVLLGLLKMRDFPHWVAVRLLCPRWHLSRRVRMSAVLLGAVSLRKMVTTDESQMEWGADR